MKRKIFAYVVVILALAGFVANAEVFRSAPSTPLTKQTLTIADDGAGTNAAATLLPTSQYIQVVCNDANGCDITLSEAGIPDGTLVYITETTNKTCNFADTAGVTDTAGAFAMGQYDSLTLLYAVDRWVEVARSNN